MKSISKLPILCILLALPLSVISQRYTDLQWSTISGLPVNLHWSSSMIASSGHIIQVGNTFTQGQNANALLTKYNTDGTINWQVEYDNPDNLEDYGIALTEDNSGNFYIAGTSFRSSSSSLDVMVVKYNSSGQFQWEYFFNGSGSGDDIPTRIITDGTDIVVVGGTESASSATDYLTLKLASNGTLSWVKLYDYNQLDDAAAAVQIDQSGQITVIGASADQVNLFDMATIKYDANGTILNEHRSNYNLGLDQPTSGGVDGSGNTVVGGWYVPTAGITEISLISLNSALGLNWSVLHDPTNGEDKILDMVVTSSGQIYVTGHCEPKPGEFAAYIAKFKNNGSLEWEQAYKQPDVNAFGKRITLSPNDKLTIAGMSYKGSDTNMLTLQFDLTGNLLLAETYDGGGQEIASTIESDFWGNIYVHGTSTVNGNGYVVLKYASFYRDFSSVDSGDYSFADDEILIQFKPSVTLNPAFSDKNKTFGILSDFIDGDAISDINSKFDDQYDFGRFNAVKVFPRLTNSDTVASTRDGGLVKLHPLWASLVVLLPTDLDEYQTSLALNALKEVIYFAEVNRVGTTTSLPDDSAFVAGGQTGMESALSPDRDIEADRAWDIFTGTSDVRVGIFDTGIKWQHPDLSKTGSQLFNDSKVVDGHDYFNDVDFNSSYFGDDKGHGTRCAGIIGAIRNNEIGVAGLAGGDAAQGEYGANLLDFKILNEVGSFNFDQTKVDMAAQAWMDASKTINDGGFGIDIMNNSWIIEPGQSIYTNESRSLLFKTNKTVYDLGVINICARGQEIGSNEVYPASLGPDAHVICIGASDETGKWASWSGTGHNIDIVAPGVQSLITTTNHQLETEPYMDFLGTSAAAPHVAGVAALLVSNDQMAEHWPTVHLVAEDIENLVEIYATPVDSVAYTHNNGWGRLNAGEVMEHMEWPFYTIKHINGNTNSYNAVQVGFNVTIDIGEDFTDLGVTEGIYTGNVYRVTIFPSHSIGNATLLNAWVRNGAAFSNMFADTLEVWDLPSASLISANATGATIRGYIYELLTDAQSNPVNAWVPFQNGGDVKYSYSLHVYDAEATGGEPENEIPQELGLIVWPNPTDGIQNVSIPSGTNIRFNLVDVNGRVIKRGRIGDAKSRQQVSLDLSKLSEGTYIYRVESNEYEFSKKVVKAAN